MDIACWVPKATDTHSLYAVLIAFTLQQCLHEYASMLHYTYIGCFVVVSTDVAVANIKVFSVAMEMSLSCTRFRTSVKNNRY
jgi:hypothetical protein